MNAKLLLLSIGLTLMFAGGLIYVRTRQTEGFKSKDPLSALKKIPKFFSYLGKFMTWIGDMIKCGVETVIGLPNCFIFYVIDIIIGFFAMIIKFFCSFSSALESARRSLWGLIKMLDKHVEEFTGYHIISWSDSILKKCYKCRNKKMPKMPKM